MKKFYPFLVFALGACAMVVGIWTTFVAVMLKAGFMGAAGLLAIFSGGYTLIRGLYRD